jgi:hypothetical protein
MPPVSAQVKCVFSTRLIPSVSDRTLGGRARVVRIRLAAGPYPDGLSPRSAPSFAGQRGTIWPHRGQPTIRFVTGWGVALARRPPTSPRVRAADSDDDLGAFPASPGVGRAD